MVSFTLYNKLCNSSMSLFRFIDRLIDRFRALAVLHCWLTLGCVSADRPTRARPVLVGL